MITKHTLIDYDVDGAEFGVIALASGTKGKAQKIFHILESINTTDPEWYLDKYVCFSGDAKNARGLTSNAKIDIGNFRGQKENPMKVFEKFPEYFL